MNIRGISGRRDHAIITYQDTEKEFAQLPTNYEGHTFSLIEVLGRKIGRERLRRRPNSKLCKIDYAVLGANTSGPRLAHGSWDPQPSPVDVCAAPRKVARWILKTLDLSAADAGER